MIQVRRNVFETNSSSTHSLAVPQKYNLYNKRRYKLIFHLGYFGRPVITKKAKATDYLYTAIMSELAWFSWELPNEDRLSVQSSAVAPDWEKYCPKAKSRLDRLIEILTGYGYAYEFEKPVWVCDDRYYNLTTPGKSYEFLRDMKYAVKEGDFINRDFGIDHYSEAEPLMDMLLANPEECMKFLLGGFVYVGSDEAGEFQQAKIHWNEKTYTLYSYVDKETGKKCRFSYKNCDNLELKEEEVPNPFYKEGYNYYEKGN